MSETWQAWVGRTVDGRFPLLSYLGGSDHSAVFLTLAQGGAGDCRESRHQVDSRRSGRRGEATAAMEDSQRTDSSESDSYFRGWTLRTRGHGAALCGAGVRGGKSIADSAGAGTDSGGSARDASADSAGFAICARHGARAWTHPTFKCSGRCGPGEAIERRSGRGG